MGIVKDIYDVAKDLGLIIKLIDRSYLMGTSQEQLIMKIF